MSAEISEIVIITLVGTFLMLFLVIFIIWFFFIHQRSKEKSLQEKAALKAQFEQEILSSENEIKEETMRFISRELHDNVVQILSLVKIQLNNLSEELPDSLKIAQSKDYLSAAITDLRALSKTLNTENILHEGLVKTIGFELQRLQKTSGLVINYQVSSDDIRLDAKQEIIVFRVFQEILQNILKHAQAKNINICLETQAETLIIGVRDDGIGFDFEEKLKNKGFDSGAGLANMVYRANLLKGSFRVLPNEDGGSLSILSVPFHLSP